MSDTVTLPSLSDFWRMLRNHDWTFEYSDDHSVWRRGTAELSAIRDVVEAGGEEYKKLFEEYSAYAWRKDNTVKQPARPERTREDQNRDRELLNSIESNLDNLCKETWALESDQITNATQLWSLLNSAQSIISKIKDILEEKSKSSMWDTVSHKNYKRLKQTVDKINS